MDNKVNIRYKKNTKHNFSFYSLSEKKQFGLSFGLDQHIPVKSNSYSIYAEFEHLIKTYSITLETYHKMRSTCKKYSQINVLYEYKIILIDLSNNRSIINLQ